MLSAEARSPDVLAAMVERRVAGEPIEHIVGWAAFADLRIAVTPGVFVPRRRSELLAREAVARVRPRSVVVDLCCGAGPLGAAIVAAEPSVELHAADVDPAAVACARANLPGASVHVGDLWAALPPVLAGRVDLVVANAPYVPTAELRLMPPEARLHEPVPALDGGDDGLAVHRRIVADAPRWLRDGGSLLIEVADPQVVGARTAFTGAGLSVTVAEDDELAAAVVIGQLIGRVTDAAAAAGGDR